MRRILVLLALAIPVPSNPSATAAHQSPTLVARAQGGLTLGPDGGKLTADFSYLDGEKE